VERRLSSHLRHPLSKGNSSKLSLNERHNNSQQATSFREDATATTGAYSPRLTSYRQEEERLLLKQEWLHKSYKQGPPARAEGRCCSSDCSAYRSGTSRVTTRLVSTGHYNCRDRSTYHSCERLPQEDSHTVRNPAACTSTVEEVRATVRDRLTLRRAIDQLYEAIDCTKKRSNVLFHSTNTIASASIARDHRESSWHPWRQGPKG
jgi:hypothetical protein